MPIVNAPMGGVAGGRLAAAVTAAGGLGMVGMGSTATGESLPNPTAACGPTFGIGLVEWVMRAEPGLLEEALAARPALLSVSFGTDWSWVARARDAGILTATQVYDGTRARQAADAGVDIVVARGSEGGGHGEAELATLAVLDAVLDSVSVPVLAGGGIASPRGLAAVLAAGAGGAWVGTRLAACPEALSGAGSRRALIAARAADTAVTRVFDVAQACHGPRGTPRGCWPTTTSPGGRAARMRSMRPRATSSPPPSPRTITVSHPSTPVGVGMIRDAAPVGQVIDEMWSGAELAGRLGRVAPVTCSVVASGAPMSGRLHPAQVALGDDALGHRHQRPGGLAPPRRRPGERRHLGEHRVRGGVAADDEAFLAGLGVAGQRAVAEPADVGFVDDVDDPARRGQKTHPHLYHGVDLGDLGLACTRSPAPRCMPQRMTASAARSKRCCPVPISRSTCRWPYPAGSAPEAVAPTSGYVNGSSSSAPRSTCPACHAEMPGTSGYGRRCDPHSKSVAQASGTFTIGGDLTVNRLGFGAMRLTGKGVWGPPADRDECVRVLRRAVELGVNFIDTADSYGP